MEEKRFILGKTYLIVKTKADCEIWCKEGRNKKITVTDTGSGECFLFMRKDFLYSHSDTLITQCHLLFKGENLESLELEESDFMPNFTTRKEFIEYKENFEDHKTEFEEHKQSNIEDFEKNEEEHEEIKKLINEKKSYVEITWGELKTLRDKYELEKGRWYLITDYTCVTNPTITTIKSAGHSFRVLVLATSVGTLSETAYARVYGKPEYMEALSNSFPSSGSLISKNMVVHIPNPDTYFKYCNLEAWELKYCLDNDQARFPWCGSDDDGGKGVIYYMKDEYGNEAYYDFKNIMERRYNATGEGIESYSKIKFFTYSTTGDARGLSWTIDKTTEWFFYTFSICLGAELTQEQILDLSVQNLASIEVAEGGIKSFGNNKLLDSHFINGTTADFHINCFLVVNGETENTLTFSGFELSGNELGNYSCWNTFNCLELTTTEKKVKTIQNKMELCNTTNIFYALSCQNLLGNNNESNYIGFNCVSLYFKNSNCNNSFIGNCSLITFGNNNNGNLIYSNAWYLSFGNRNIYISIKNSCEGLSFGNYNRDCTIGYKNIGLSFGNYNRDIIFGNENQYDSLGNGNRYWKIGDTLSTPNVVVGCTIGNNLQYSDSNYKTISSVTNQQYWT